MIPDVVGLVTDSILAGSVEGGIGGGNALANRPDYTALLGQITVPALILVGAQATVTPIPLAQDLDQGIARSKLLILENVSHLSFLEDPEEANEAIAHWVGRAVPAATP